MSRAAGWYVAGPDGCDEDATGLVGSLLRAAPNDSQCTRYGPVCRAIGLLLRTRCPPFSAHSTMTGRNGDARRSDLAVRAPAAGCRNPPVGPKT